VGIAVFIILCDLSSVSFPTLGEAQRPISTPYWDKLRTEKNLEAPELFQIPPGTSSAMWQSVSSVHQAFTQISIPFSKRNTHGAWSDQYLPLLKNTGVVDAYETLPFERYAIAQSDEGYKGEYYLTGSGAISLKQWSPNRLVFYVKANNGDQLVINQNFADGWHSSRGNLTTHGGLLAVDLPSGDYELEIYYLPRSFLAGACIFVMTLVVLVLIATAKTFNHLRNPLWLTSLKL
jgi:hypothetical protein